MNISILIATRKRPLSLQRTIDSAMATAKYPDLIDVSIYVDIDDLETQEYLKTAKNNIQATIGDRIILSDMHNRAYKKATADIIMACGDDCTFKTKNWDEIVMNIFDKYDDKIVLVFGNDLAHHGRLATHGFLHRRWIETVGYVMPPYFSCDYADTWINDVSEMLGRRIYVPELIFEHIHWIVDETNKERAARGIRDDVGRIYFQLSNKRQEDVQKLICAMRN